MTASTIPEPGDPLDQPLWPRLELPQGPRKIRERIRRYERKLRKQKSKYGFISDGAGSRFLIGPLYLLMDDVAGAAEAYAWFEDEFPDDGGEPGHRLCWALMHLRSGEPTSAVPRFRQAMLLNLYLIPRLLGMETKRLDISHGSSDAEPWYPDTLPIDYFTMWNEEELEWASTLYHGEELTDIRTRYIEIEGELNGLPPGPHRSRLVSAASALLWGS